MINIDIDTIKKHAVFPGAILKSQLWLVFSSSRNPLHKCCWKNNRQGVSCLMSLLLASFLLTKKFMTGKRQTSSLVTAVPRGLLMSVWAPSSEWYTEPGWAQVTAAGQSSGQRRLRQCCPGGWCNQRLWRGLYFLLETSACHLVFKRAVQGCW